MLNVNREAVNGAVIGYCNFEYEHMAIEKARVRVLEVSVRVRVRVLVVRVRVAKFFKLKKGNLTFSNRSNCFDADGFSLNSNSEKIN